MTDRENQWRYRAPPGWRDIEDAPRDGTPIKLLNNWGSEPSVSVSKWIGGKGWRHVEDEKTLSFDGPHLSWRPHLHAGQQHGATSAPSPVGSINRISRTGIVTIALAFFVGGLVAHATSRSGK